jgi:DNA-binding transcriptional regulator YiaG
MRKSMSPLEFMNARAALGWSYPELANTLGVSLRTPFRWASGENNLQGPEARLLRLLVLLRLTVSAHKFNELIEELRR